MKLKNYFKTKGVIIQEFYKLKSKGFVSFVISSSISRAISFVSIIFLARILTKSDYGLLSYVDNIRNYVLIINGLGLSNVVLRYCAQNNNLSTNKGYLYSSLGIGIVFDVIIIGISLLFFSQLQFDYPEANRYLISMAFLPLFIYMFESFQMFFRATFRNSLFSIVTIVYSALMIILQIIMGYFFDLLGIVYGRYIAIILSIIFALVIYFVKYHDRTKITLPTKIELKAMILLGISFLIAGASSTMITYNETIVISKFVLNKEILADYKAASLILQITYFFINSIVLFSFPYFVRNKLSLSWIKTNFNKLTKYLVVLMIPVHLFLYLGMNLIISVIFGSEYLTSVPFARFILISSLIQTVFRMPLGNILIAVGKEKANVIINLVSLLIHFVLAYYLTSIFSVIGGMSATMIIYALSSVVMYMVLNRYLRGSVKNEILA